MTDQVTEEIVEVVTETVETKIDPEEFASIKAENERLKAFHDKVHKENESKVAKAKAESDRLAKEKAESEGDLKKLLELKEQEYQDMLNSKEQELLSFREKEVQQQVNKVADQVARELAKEHSGRQSHLAEKLALRLKLTEDGVKVTDGKGNIISDKLDTLKEYAKKELDFLCDGLQSTGGAGIVAVKPTGNKDNKVAENEQLALYRSDPVKWREKYGKRQ